jgi:hypothetical protein
MSEEFAAIIELLQGAGVGTIWCFIGYLVYQMVQTVLAFTGIVVVLRTLGFVIKGICDRVMRAGHICKHIRESLKLGCQGPLDDKEFCKIETAVGQMLDGRNK